MNKKPAMSYGAQLKSPFWQRKRLEVLEAAEFKCQRCWDSESTLHVHHKRYVKGRMAWEYSVNELLSLCESCHSVEHQMGDVFKTILATLDSDGPNGLDSVYGIVAGWVKGFATDEIPEFDEFVQVGTNPSAFALGTAIRNIEAVNTREFCANFSIASESFAFINELSALVEKHKTPIKYESSGL
jgi:hypothetical protein